MPEQPKRHHQVPRWYLARFAEAGRIFVRRRAGNVFLANPINVAVESGFYDVTEPEDGDPAMIERLLARVEASAKEALDTIDAMGRAPTEGSDDRETLAAFLACQMARTTEARERAMFPELVRRWAGKRELTVELMSEFLETEYLGFPPREREAEAALLYVTVGLRDGAATNDFAVGSMLRSIDELMPHLLSRWWAIEVDPREGFITSDTPVVLWRKRTRQDEYGGMGITGATELRFPLDPGRQLVLGTRKRRPVTIVAPHRVRRCNADMGSGCHRLILGRPVQREEILRIALHARRPVVRFNIGPLVREGPDGRRVRTPGEVLHMWIPRGSEAGRPSGT